MLIVQFVNEVLNQLPADIQIKAINTCLNIETSSVLFHENEYRLDRITFYNTCNGFEFSAYRRSDKELTQLVVCSNVKELIPKLL